MNLSFRNGFFAAGFFLLMLVVFTGCGNQSDGPRELILATTTSTQDSGLLDVLLPLFEEETGYLVKPIAVGTGAALEMGRRGDADVLLTHAPAAEKPLVDEGIVINYQRVMHNDFVIIGPPDDPAAVRGLEVSEALKAIAAGEFLFISRGDDSGTHKRELALWEAAGIDPEGRWYQESGQGMGATIKIASEKGAYTLSDRATYLNLREGLRLDILIEGDENLKNIYHVMQVNPEKFEGIEAEGAGAFVEFMIREDTQRIIGRYGVDRFGQPLFFPDRL